MSSTSRGHEAGSWLILSLLLRSAWGTAGSELVLRHRPLAHIPLDFVTVDAAEVAAVALVHVVEGFPVLEAVRRPDRPARTTYRN